MEAHVPNPGRMEELLLPGRTRGYAVRAPGLHRKTQFDLVSVYHDHTLVSIDSRVANRLVRSALEAGQVPGWPSDHWSAEPRWGEGRLDFARLARPGGRPTALLEVKSSNRRVGATSLFPDAPTLRGTRHVLALRTAATRGIRCGVIFVLQRPDTTRFRPNWALDPHFAEALASAARARVRVQAFRTRVRADTVLWEAEVPVDLSKPSGPPKPNLF